MELSSLTIFDEPIKKCFGADLVNRNIVYSKDDTANFFVTSLAGILGFGISLDDNGSCTVLQINLWLLMFEGDAFRSFDLSSLDLAGWRTLVELQKQIEWSAITFVTEDGGYSPVLTRFEMLESEEDFSETEVNRVMYAIAIMAKEACSILPVIASISVGISVPIQEVRHALEESQGGLQ